MAQLLASPGTCSKDALPGVKLCDQIAAIRPLPSQPCLRESAAL
jgi:hypothetical protein